MPHAIVSGLGPNGMLAARTLLEHGWHVTGVEQRAAYGRGIHLSLRQSYFDAVRALDASLADALSAIASDIEALEHVGHASVRPAPRTIAMDASVRERLEAPPVKHVRLDKLEQTWWAHLTSCAPDRLRVARGSTFAIDAETHACRIDDEDVAQVDLVVIAEGGKSRSAQQLGLAPVRLSAARLYQSVHVQESVGPVTRRMDADVDVAGVTQRVSFWATGHGDAALGTWLVLEVPAAIHGDRPSRVTDRAYFDRWARALLGLAHAPTPTSSPFSGTFRFEQQMLRVPRAEGRVLFFGDAAGMGHHAPSTGLELGVCDQRALAAVLAGGTLDAYGRTVARARVALLAFGLREYYPGLTVDPTPFIEAALEAPAEDARAIVEARVTAATGQA